MALYSPWLIPPAEQVFPEAVSARKAKVALIGLDVGLSERLHEQLGELVWDFGSLAFSDFGRVRKTTVDFVVPLLRELHTAGIVPLLVGSERSLLVAQYQAFGELNRQVGVAVADQRVRLGTEENLYGCVHRTRSPRYHLSHLGSQQQLTPPSYYREMANGHHEFYGLGEARADLQRMEPVLRDADLVAIDAAAINFCEAPARATFHPSGFSLQEACQLAYYAGNSDKLSSFGVYGFDPTGKSATEIGLTVAAYAQLLWYCCLGLSKRRGDFPVSLKGMSEYIVDLSAGERVTFWRSPETNRWWLQVPAGKYDGEQRHRLVACSYEDYRLSGERGKLPERLLSALGRFS